MIRVALAAALALLTLFLLVETIKVAEGIANPQTPATNTIVVSGEGKAAAVPDTATITYSFTKTEPKVADAQAQVTKLQNDALTYLKQQGIAEADIRTVNYSISPHYERTTCTTVYCPPAKITGYDVTHTVSVKIHDLSNVGTIIGGLGNLGATDLSGPNFTVNDPTQVEAQARAEAITKAKAQAQTLANQLGVHLVRIVHYSETPNTPPIIYASGLGGATKAESSTPTIPAGQNEYTVNVSITYEIR